MITNRHLRRTGAIAAIGASVAIALSGCGGSSTNASQSAATVADPIVYGINFNNGFEGSNIAFPSADGKNTLGAVVGAISSTAAGLPREGGINTGFVPGGQNIVPTPTAPAAGQPATPPPFLSYGFALPASQPNCVFRALVGNGNIASSSGGIDGNSLFLTTPEVPAFKQQLTFDNAGIGVGPAGNGQYASAPFTLPFTTTGLHTLVVSVADLGSRSSTTTFQALVLAPTDSAVVVQTVDAKGNPLTGATVSITGAITGVAAYASTPAAPQVSVSDANGTAIVFAAPGKQTISAAMGTTLVGSDTQALVAGQALTASDAQTAYAITLAAPAAAAPAAHVRPLRKTYH